ncbi:hypothetical protein ACWDR0_04790 [Streptomyces sp. NPDC003691]
MADDRNEWLDQVTAERLMRGEPVSGLGELGGPARAEAARLAGALRAVAAPEAGADRGELPGEAAAVAAFRAAAASAAAGPRSADGATSLGIVKLAPGAVPDTGAPRGARGAGHRRKLSAPFRLGVVAVVAGFAFGGVAVASGADFLPSPFDGAGPTATGTSVSAGPGERPDAGPRAPGPATEGLSPGDGGPPSSSPARPVGSTPKPELQGEPYHRVARACREHRAGTTRPEGRALLQRLAGKPELVGPYCDGVLGTALPGAGAGDNRGSQGRVDARNGAGKVKGNGKVKNNKNNNKNKVKNKGGQGQGNANGNANGNATGNPAGNATGNGGAGSGQGTPGGGTGAQDALPPGHGHGGPHNHDRKAEKTQKSGERRGVAPGRRGATSGSGTGTGPGESVAGSGGSAFGGAAGTVVFPPVLLV